jgi:hypothetical protein
MAMLRCSGFLLAWCAVFAFGGISSEVVLQAADPIFEKPVRLTADGKIIDTGPDWGHSSPCIEDLDGDGLNDLLLGDFSGKFQIYRNIGDVGHPSYHRDGFLQAGGKDAQVHIYCCVGGQPRFLDLNGDGLQDFISNSYDPGYCYYFQGLPDHRFEAPKELLDRSGVPVRSSPRQQQDIQSFGSFYTPVDWDADGDLDMLIGCFGGELKLRLNEGNSRKQEFSVENRPVLAGAEPMQVKHHFCPVIADWDSDGAWDILAGCDDGSVTWFRNVGAAGNPQFEPGTVLVPAHAGNGYDLLRWNESDTVPGIRSQIEVVDYNRDGKLDLLLGDFCTAYEPKPDLTEHQKQQMEGLISQFQNLNKPFTERFQKLREDFQQRYPGDSIYSDEATEAWSKAYRELREGPEAKEMERKEAEFTAQMRPFLAATHGTGDHSYELALPHGYVWLFLRH